MTPTLVNVMKVADIDSATISKELKEAIEAYGPTYSDTVLNEDLFSVDGFCNCIPPGYETEFAAIKKMCDDNDASYIRFVEP